MNFTIPFTTSGNYTFDSGKIEFDSGLARLIDILQDQTLIAHYKLNDNAGNSTVLDSSGNSYDGIFKRNGSPRNTSLGNDTGKINDSITFDGSNTDEVDLTTHIANFTSLSEGSISIWFKTTQDGLGTLFSLSNTSQLSTEFVLRCPDSVGNGHIRFGARNESNLIQATSPLEYNDGSWHHLVLTVSTSNGTKIYVDGSEITPNFTSGSASSHIFLSDINSPNKLRLGINEDNGGTEWEYTGNLDDVRVYSTELSSTQVSSIYNSGNGTESPDRFASDEPTVYKTAGDTTANISTWTGFTVTEGTVEGSLRYQLSNDGIDWKYWNGSSWVTAVGLQYNSEADVNTNINNFPITDKTIYVRTFLISDGDQKVEIDNITISFTENPPPVIDAGGDKTAIYNVATNPFSDATITDETFVTKAEYKLTEDVTWNNIPKGSFSTFQEAIRNQSVAFTHSGTKELQLRVTDSFSQQTIDTLNINVNRINITINITDEFGTDLPDVTFDPNDGLTSSAVYDSPFTLDYGIGTFTYTASKEGFNTVSASTTIDITSTSLTIQMSREIRIEELQFNVDFNENVSKGDTMFIDFRITNKDLTNWKVRCEIFDDSGHSIKLGTSNVDGGSTTQINQLNPETGEFLIKVAKDLTTNFDDTAHIEVELENPEGQKRILWDHEFKFMDEQINWDSTTE